MVNQRVIMVSTFAVAIIFLCTAVVMAVVAASIPIRYEEFTLQTRCEKEFALVCAEMTFNVNKCSTYCEPCGGLCDSQYILSGDPNNWQFNFYSDTNCTSEPTSVLDIVCGQCNPTTIEFPPIYETCNQWTKALPWIAGTGSVIFFILGVISLVTAVYLYYQIQSRAKQPFKMPILYNENL